MSQVTFIAYIKPQPQGSMKYVGHRGGRPVLISDNAALKSMRKMVGDVALLKLRELGHQIPMAGKHVPVEAIIEFTFEKPKSAKKRTHHIVKPDLDKTCRSAFDSLTGIVWHDDAQVVSCQISKSYGPVASVHVSARTIEPTSSLEP